MAAVKEISTNLSPSRSASPVRSTLNLKLPPFVTGFKGFPVTVDPFFPSFFEIQFDGHFGVLALIQYYRFVVRGLVIG